MACSAHLDVNNPCPSCTTPREKHTRKGCRDCLKKKCAIEKGIRWCFECERFPCTKIKSLDKRYKQNYAVDLTENGFKAKESMSSFLQEQKRRFTCNNCGGVIDQHHKKCSECGSER